MVGRDVIKTRSWALSLICSIFIIQTGFVNSSLIMLLRGLDGIYYQCDTTGDTPQSCNTMAAETALFPSVTSPLVGMSLQFCNAAFNSYHFFSSASGSELYRNPIPLSDTSTVVQNLDTAAQNGNAVTSFDLCCGSVVYAISHKIVAQNLNEDSSVPKITATLYEDASERAIQHVEVCCESDKFQILFSIDGDGLYSMGMDGGDPVQMVDYDGSETILSMDYNCVTGNDHIAIGSGMEVRLLDTDGLDPNTFPVMYSTIPVWEVNDANLVEVSLASLSSTSAPVTVAIWGAGSSAPATVTSTAMAPNDVSATVPAGDAVTWCNSEMDCACPMCACDVSDDYQDCCTGLCLPQNAVAGRSYSCHCNSPDTFSAEGCTISQGGTLPPYPTSCPLDLIGAIKCQGGNREGTSSVYALSQYSMTSVCSTPEDGHVKARTLLSRGGIPFVTGNLHTSGWRFKAPTPWHDFKGDRYGMYTVRTGAAVSDGSMELVDSLQVVFQESSKDLYADYVTITAITGRVAEIQVHIRRPCDVRRVRWRKDGLSLHKYKGKAKIRFASVSPSDGGVYEAYFQGRIQRDWRVMVRMIVTNEPSCDPECTTNNGICSYAGNCICPPGQAGVNCENSCPKGTFGIIGQCGFSCHEEFGEDFADCQNILLCLEDPAGCYCYPGHELPDCNVCRRGYWGLNCENGCIGECDPYDGSR